MTDSMLDFKKKFILQNLADMKSDWHISENYREKLRFWFLVIWFGTVSLFLKDNNKFNISFLLALETIIFFIFDLLLSLLNRFRLERISMVEHQIMSVSEQEILDLKGPLSKWAGENGFTRQAVQKNLLKKSIKAILDPYISVLYLIFFLFSFLFKKIV